MYQDGAVNARGEEAGEGFLDVLSQAPIDGPDGRRKPRCIVALEKATDGWEGEKLPPLADACEGLLVTKLVALRTERYVWELVVRLTTDLDGMGSAFHGGSCAFVVMILCPVLQQQMYWLHIEVGSTLVQGAVNEGDL